VAAIHLVGVRGEPCGALRHRHRQYWIEKCRVKHWNSDVKCYCSAFYADGRAPCIVSVQSAQLSVSCVWLPALCMNSKVSADCCLSDWIVGMVYIDDMINLERSYVVTYYLLCEWYIEDIYHMTWIKHFH